MGVMSCSRKGCENILCDTYIPDIGYICTSCKEEFKEKYPNIQGEQIIFFLKEFISTRKYDIEKDTTVEDYFRQHTRED